MVHQLAESLAAGGTVCRSWLRTHARNFSTNEIVGMAAASPSGQNVRPSMFLANSPIMSISVRVPCPSSNRVRIFLQPGGAFAAGDAPAAAFVGVEAHDAERGFHHVGVFVHHDDAAGAEHGSCAWPRNRSPWRAVALPSAVSTGQLEPPGMTAFNFLPAAYAAADLLDHPLTREAQSEFVDAGLVDVAR